MRSSWHKCSCMVAAFGIGVLFSMIFPSDLMLIVTIIALILVAIGGFGLIRG